MQRKAITERKAKKIEENFNRMTISTPLSRF
jgi:hypothetical protein